MEAAKSVVVNEAGELLLQLRDDDEAIQYPSRWDLFGGGVLDGEAPEKSIVRELEEELGITIGEPKRLFSARGDWDNVLNHVFWVPIQKTAITEFLGEGSAKMWVGPDKIPSLNTTPIIHRYFFELGNALKANWSTIFSDTEGVLLGLIGLRKKNDRVYLAQSRLTSVSMQQLWLLAAVAKHNGVSIFRVCCHQDEHASVQEMFICHLVPQVVGPLRQPRGDTISFTALAGEGAVTTYSGNQIDREFKLTAKDSDGVRSIRVDADIMRSIKSVEAPFIFLEINKGPFQDSDTEWVGSGQ